MWREFCDLWEPHTRVAQHCVFLQHGASGAHNLYSLPAFILCGTLGDKVVGGDIAAW